MHGFRLGVLYLRTSEYGLDGMEVGLGKGVGLGWRSDARPIYGVRLKISVTIIVLGAGQWAGQFIALLIIFVEPHSTAISR